MTKDTEYTDLLAEIREGRKAREGAEAHLRHVNTKLFGVRYDAMVLAPNITEFAGLLEPDDIVALLPLDKLNMLIHDDFHRRLSIVPSGYQAGISSALIRLDVHDLDDGEAKAPGMYAAQLVRLLDPEYGFTVMLSDNDENMDATLFSLAPAKDTTIQANAERIVRQIGLKSGE